MAVLVAFGALITTLLGGLVAFKVKDKLHLILGLAAGLMLGVILFDIIPESIALTGLIHGIPIAMIMVAVGFVAVHMLERFTGGHHNEHDEDDHHDKASLATALAMIGHSTLDGIGIGLAFHLSAGLGLLVGVAVLAHDFADGFNTATIGRHLHTSTRLSLLVADGLAPLAGVLLTMAFVVSTGVLGALLGLFGGSLLYIATGNIIPEAHSSHPTKLTFLFTGIGLLIMFILIGIAV